MSNAIEITKDDIKLTEALNKLIKSLKKKRKSLPSRLRESLIRLIEKKPELVTVQGSKIILGVSFYAEWVKEHNLDSHGAKIDKDHYKFFRKLRKYGSIHIRSSYFPKKLSLISISPTFPSLYKGNFRNIDRYIDAKRSLYSEYISTEQMIEDMYIDMRLYQLPSFTARELKALNIGNIIFIDEATAFVYIEERGLVENIPVPPYQLISVSGLALIAALQQCAGNGMIYPFSDTALEKKLTLHRDMFFSGMSLYDIRMASQNAYLLKMRPVAAAIRSSRKVLSPVTISELSALYPSRIPKHLIELEEKRISYALTRANDNSDGTVFDSSFSLEEFDALTELLKIKSTYEFKKKIPSVIRELRKYASSSEAEPHGILIVKYIEFALSRIEGKNKIKISTLKGYYYLLKKHLFTKIEDLSNVQAHEINDIMIHLSQQQYKDKSIVKVKFLIRGFFAFHNQEHNPIQMRMSSYPKSLVFDSEIDTILDTISTNITTVINRVGNRVQYRILRDQTIVLLARYTGVRKNELRSRLLKDFYIYENTLCVDVNSKGMRKLDMQLKTPSAKRRICVEIGNLKHLNIIKEYLRFREDLNNENKFLFLDAPLVVTSKRKEDHFGGNKEKDEKKISYYTIRSKPMVESMFDDISSVIQQVTKRYTSFHSLRHSFATYSVLEILSNSNTDPYQLIDLAIKMGHLSPEITLKVYTHRSVLDFGGV